jgi:hypothetical protein
MIFSILSILLLSQDPPPKFKNALLSCHQGYFFKQIADDSVFYIFPLPPVATDKKLSAAFPLQAVGAVFRRGFSPKNQKQFNTGHL